MRIPETRGGTPLRRCVQSARTGIPHTRGGEPTSALSRPRKCRTYTCLVRRQPYGLVHLLVQGLTRGGVGPSVTWPPQGILGGPRFVLPTRHPAGESPAGRAEVGWDGQSLQGTIVPSGTYVIRIRARADDGQQATGIGMLHAAR
jgi:hypothetical protein